MRYCAYCTLDRRQRTLGHIEDTVACVASTLTYSADNPIFSLGKQFLLSVHVTSNNTKPEKLLITSLVQEPPDIWRRSARPRYSIPLGQKPPSYPLSSFDSFCHGRWIIATLDRGSETCRPWLHGPQLLLDYPHILDQGSSPAISTTPEFGRCSL